ncbi:MAG: HAD-IA family hydrolase [Deltaproteobacteria bacterium]
MLDFGGVCLVTPFELHRSLERKAGLEPGTFSWMGPLDPASDSLWRRLLAKEVTEREYWHQRTRDVGDALGRGDDWDLRAYMTLAYDEPESTIIRPSANDIVRDAKAEGRKVGILTNDLYDFHGEAWVDSIAFFKTVDTITDASRIPALKPDPRAFEKALVDLGVEKEEVVFVDDQVRNCEGAVAFGLNTVRFDAANVDASWDDARRRLGLRGAA